MKVGFLSRRGRAPSISAGALLLCAIVLTTFAANAGPSPPLKLAIFDFELEDFSAGATLAAGNPADDSEQLKTCTNEARRLIAQPGRYTLVDISSADAQAVKEHWQVRWLRGRNLLEARRGAILYRDRDEDQQNGILGAVSDPRRPNRRRHLQQAD
jgi:hypothetical protein